jgi:hypothetical protein
MSAILDEIKLSFSKAYELIKKAPEQLFINLLKVNALAAVATFAGLLIAGLLVYISTGGNFMNAGSAEVVFIVSIVAVMSLVSAAIGSVSYNVIQNTVSNKKTKILFHLKENFVPVIILTLVLLIGMAIIATPLIISLMLGGPQGIFLVCGAFIVSVIAFIAFVFLTQFSILELVLEKKGVFESISSSVDVVRKNIITIFILDIVIMLISIVSTAGTSIIESLLEVIPNMLVPLGLSATIVGYALYFLIFYVIMIAVSSATQMLIIPMMYYFWKKAKS